MTNTANSPLRLLPRPEPFEQEVEAFGRRLAADGRSPNTISAYLRDLKRFTGVLLTRHPGVTISQVTPGMLDEALTASAVAHTASGAPRSPASLHRFKAAIRSFFAWPRKPG